MGAAWARPAMCESAFKILCVLLFATDLALNLNYCFHFEYFSIRFRGYWRPSKNLGVKEGRRAQNWASTDT